MKQVDISAGIGHQGRAGLIERSERLITNERVTHPETFYRVDVGISRAARQQGNTDVCSRPLSILRFAKN